MNNRQKPGLTALTLTTSFLTICSLAHADICCERMDGNRGVGPSDTGVAVAQEARLDLYVDSARSYYSSSWHTYAALRVLARRPVDTAVFFDALPNPAIPYPAWLTSVSYTGTGFPDTLLVSDESATSDFLKEGDTLKDVFTIRITSSRNQSFYAFSGIRCKFQSPSAGPFPIGKALSALKGYLDSAGTAQGGYVPAHLKLGPVFIAVPGDPGLLVTAAAEGNDWIIRYQTGGGDCPMGCTEHDETLYRVSANGGVEVVSTRHFFALCWVPPNAISEKPMPGGPFRGNERRYTPEGRRLPGTGMPTARMPWIEAPRP